MSTSTWRCKDKRGRYYVGPGSNMTKRERLRAHHWLDDASIAMIPGCNTGKFVYPDVPRMVAKQLGPRVCRVVRCIGKWEQQNRAEARGEVRALEAVDSLGAEAVPVLLADARKRAGIRDGGR